MKSMEELISIYNKPTYIHLGRSQNISQGIEAQLYAWGYNASGRPDGLWMSPGNAWLKYTVEKNDPRYPPCCFIYEIDNVKNILTISEENFVAFDNTYPNYWLNLDYYDVNFTDKLKSDVHYVAKKKSVLDFTRLDKTSMQSLYDILIQSDIIFTSAAEARTKCEFYNKLPIDTVERFKYKNWDAVSEDYAGVLFKYKPSSICDKYFWHQSLDVESGCLWDTRSTLITLKYIKKSSKWKHII